MREVRKRQSTLLFQDEAGVREDGPIGTTWGERGATPALRVTGGHRRTHAIWAISPRGRLRFRGYSGKLNAQGFIEFLRALSHDLRKKIDVAVDRNPPHTAAAVARFVAAQNGRIRLHVLPRHAPDPNADEHVWTYLKGMFRRDPLYQDEDLERVVKLSMNKIQRNWKLVRSFFVHPEVEYIRKALRWGGHPNRIHPSNATVSIGRLFFGF